MFSKNTKYPKHNSIKNSRLSNSRSICKQKTKRAAKKDTKKLLDKKLDCKAIVVLKLQVQQMEDKKEISLYQNKSLTLDFGQVI